MEIRTDSFLILQWVSLWYSYYISRLCPPVLRLDEVGHILRLRVEVLDVVVVVVVGVLGRTDVVHLVGAAALHAALHRLLPAQLTSI